jgi:hypothetical protein
MTIALTTRGMICPNGSHVLARISWGFLCTSREREIGFLVEPSPPTKTCVYNKDGPQILDPSSAGLFSTPSIQLTGQKSPLLGSKRPSLVSPTSPGLFSASTVQLTGSKVVTVVGNKNLLLSEPQEPTLTSSGTRAPDIFNKDCCDDC